MTPTRMDTINSKLQALFSELVDELWQGDEVNTHFNTSSLISNRKCLSSQASYRTVSVCLLKHLVYLP